MNTMFIGVGLAAVALLTPGCLDKDTAQTIYLEADGAVTWTVFEKEVRSDGKTVEERALEEAEFFVAARMERHPVALGFARLDPIGVRTSIVRGERPYSVLTEARFVQLDLLMARFVEAMGADGTSTLERRGGTTTWTLTVQDDSKPSSWRGEDEAVDALYDGFERCRFVLAAGHFTSALGFELSPDTHVATLHLADQPSGAAADPPATRLALTWVDKER